MKRPALADLPSHVELLVVGGGITGAGILREAARTGAQALLIEQHDYASGTSSGSSKLVHGGLRYLKNARWRLTLESVRERQRLLREAPGLVEPQPFLMPLYRGMRPGRRAMQLGLWLYDRMAGTASSHWVDPAAALALEPDLRREGLLGAMQYEDARTDDARLVWSVLVEALEAGAQARNYTRATVLRRGNGRVCGAVATDVGTGESREIEADVVVDATGAAAGALGGAGSGAPRLRPLRGSHLVFPAARLPVRRAVSWLHPRDLRPVFAYPWQGAVVYGTTDLDHAPDAPVRMSGAEADYLVEGLAHQFPGLLLGIRDATSCYSAIRPVVAGGKARPSDESRESALWTAPGLVGITGGKLTTFRVTARQVLAEAARQCPRLAPGAPAPVFAQPPPPRPVDALAALRTEAAGSHVVHLDDLLLRRSRVGLVAPGLVHAAWPRIAALCGEQLGWDTPRFAEERARYEMIWRRDHAPGGAA